jgi:hypothetical protein
MTRTAIRHTLTAVAAVALVSAASGAAAAKIRAQHYHNEFISMVKGYMTKTPKGLTTKKPALNPRAEPLIEPYRGTITSGDH